jgi:hypothetical protein
LEIRLLVVSDEHFHGVQEILDHFRRLIGIVFQGTANLEAPNR